MVNVFDLPQTIPPRFAWPSKILPMNQATDHQVDYAIEMDYDADSWNEDTNGAIQRLRKLRIRTERRIATIRNPRGAALSLIEMLATQKKSGRKRSAPNGHIISGDSDEDILDESSNDDVASEEEIETQHECISCMEEYSLSDIIETECGHSYCRECIVRLFENSLANEALFPPRCCRLPIPVSTAIEDMIGIEMTKRYKERETETSDSDRTYCSKPACSRYIPPQNIRRGVGICESCNVRTCTYCKMQGHRGDCNGENVNKNISARDDEKANEDLLEQLAKKKKWQRCSKCSRIIEHVTGCYHIR